jgi:hypothetical protein
MNKEKPPAESPQKRERCPQNFFDPVLQKFATYGFEKNLPTLNTLIQYMIAQDVIAKKMDFEELFLLVSMPALLTPKLRVKPSPGKEVICWRYLVGMNTRIIQERKPYC